MSRKFHRGAEGFVHVLIKHQPSNEYTDQELNCLGAALKKSPKGEVDAAKCG
jgi:hypothetical protein